MPEENKTVVVKSSGGGAYAYGPATGNALAYFAIWYAGWKHNVKFDDGELAIAMGGALMTTLILELRRTFSWLGRMLNHIIDVFGKDK